MNFILILLATYLSRVEEDIVQLENKVSPYVVALHAEDGDLTMTGTIVEKNHIVTVGFIEIGQIVQIEDKFGNVFNGEVLGRDPSTGIHLIKAKKKFQAPSANKETTKGQLCAVYGNSFGSMGIIGIGFLQSPEGISFNLSVPLSPGNNGAGVFNSQGELLGIVGGMVKHPVSPENIFGNTNNFAEVIKVDYILNTVDQIKKIGVVRRAWLGVVINNAPGNMGVVIKEVIENSPAETAGLKKGDIIIALNGNNIPNLERLKEIILTGEPGETVTLTIIRGKSRKEVPIELKERQVSVKLKDSSDFKIEKIIPERFTEQKEALKETLREKIFRFSKELEKLKRELESLK